MDQQEGCTHTFAEDLFTLGTSEGGSATAVILVRDGTAGEKVHYPHHLRSMPGGQKKRGET